MSLKKTGFIRFLLDYEYHSLGLKQEPFFPYLIPE
jgi:hypothetical protein